MSPVGIGVIGCGNISNQYLKNLAAFPDVRVLILADLDVGRAKTQAAAYGVPAWGRSADALARPGVELIVHLTVPAAHAQVSEAAIAAGKHVWSEKPLTLDIATGRALLAAADAAGVRVGCAPDTALAEYAADQAASLLFSWDSPLSRSGFVEITGTEATLAVPDPNHFGGDLRLRKAGDDDWTVVPSQGAAAGRGSGVVDMVRAIRAGVPHRASGELALHVPELMAAIERSATSAAFQDMTTRFDVPAPLDAQWDPYVTTD